jgi:hypothetical protein
MTATPSGRSDNSPMKEGLLDAPEAERFVSALG